jgi:predicted dehydrogenase
MTQVHLPIRVGVIGAGFIGPAHIESIRRLGYVEVAALAGSSQSSAEAKARELFVPKAYGDFFDLIRDPEIDVVDISSPNVYHYPAARAALEAGKHVMCEKPLGMTSAESAELVELADRTGLVNAVTLNVRFYPVIRHAKALIERGDLGTIFSVHGGYWQEWLLYDTDYNWRVEAGAGGKLRAIGDVGSHWMDLAQFVTGQRITQVLAEMSTFLPVRQKPDRPLEAFSTADVPRTPVNVDTEDAATVLLHFGDGARGTMQVSQVAAGRKNRVAIEVNGSKASLAWDGEHPNELWIGYRDRPNEVLIKDPALLAEEARPYARYPAGHDEGFADTHTAIERSFYDFIRAGGYASDRQPDFPTFVDGHRENVLGDCILESAGSQRWVDVPQ